MEQQNNNKEYFNLILIKFDDIVFGRMEYDSSISYLSGLSFDDTISDALIDIGRTISNDLKSYSDGKVKKYDEDDFGIECEAVKIFDSHSDWYDTINIILQYLNDPLVTFNPFYIFKDVWSHIIANISMPQHHYINY